eukprot:CAMPEP_0179952952 /NCGR_PEP_ID=MMETSP0983-20121128/24598_1 /TAXON_ID=483367 /ORGANISM="non described non described, Strain CCMP 2436" /LENGTH=164 /DNA_ID=CAMNT_0021863703 /DNA_START=142 /DNA_END=632 /DNA_ORIENTATION=-
MQAHRSKSLKAHGKVVLNCGDHGGDEFEEEDEVLVRAAAGASALQLLAQLLHHLRVPARVDAREDAVLEVRVWLDRARLVGVLRRYILEHLRGQQRLAGLGVPVQPHTRAAVVLVVRDRYIVGARAHDVVRRATAAVSQAEPADVERRDVLLVVQVGDLEILHR